MQASIAQILASISDVEGPGRLLGESIAALQDPGYFSLAFQKQQRRATLCQHFKGQPLPRVLLSYGLRHLLAEHPGLKVETLAADYFAVADEEALETKAAFLAGAVVISENNDAGFHAPGYVRLFERCQQTLFAIWDQDNHHWLKNSAILAAHCDLYVPAHNDNLYALSRFNPSTTSALPCAVIQWSRPFLAESVALLLAQPRSDQPLGRHAAYAAFGYRNQVITTLSKSIATVCFVDGRQFRTRTPQDRLLEWASHKVHWIVPTLNDIPQRLFDALATGGIAIVPEALRLVAPVSEIAREIGPGHVCFYAASDVVDPTRVVAQALQSFDRAGAGGIVARHHWAINQHHGDQRMLHILRHLSEAFGLQASAWL